MRKINFEGARKLLQLAQVWLNGERCKRLTRHDELKLQTIAWNFDINVPIKKYLRSINELCIGQRCGKIGGGRYQNSSPFALFACGTIEKLVHIYLWYWLGPLQITASNQFTYPNAVSGHKIYLRMSLLWDGWQRILCHFQRRPRPPQHRYHSKEGDDNKAVDRVRSPFVACFRFQYREQGPLLWFWSWSRPGGGKVA